LATSFNIAMRIAGTLLLFALIAFVGRVQAADALSKVVVDYKPFAVEHIGIALAGAKELRAAVKAGDVKAAQAAWIKSRTEERGDAGTVGGGRGGGLIDGVRRARR